jgi:hypothetical protein
MLKLTVLLCDLKWEIDRLWNLSDDGKKEGSGSGWERRRVIYLGKVPSLNFNSGLRTRIHAICSLFDPCPR